MAKKRFSPAQIVTLLQQIEVATSSEKSETRATRSGKRAPSFATQRYVVPQVST